MRLLQQLLHLHLLKYYAQLYNFSLVNDGEFEVYENGENLNSDLKQKLSIARSIAHKRKIYVLLQNNGLKCDRLHDKIKMWYVV